MEINFMLNNSVLNVTNILNLCNVACDTNNNSIKNDIKSLHGNMQMAVTARSRLLIVAFQLLCDIAVLVLLTSKA